MVAVEKGRWGTWEELLLGGAVLRYGTQSWNAVALELRARTVYPYNFTAEACKAKFEDLKQRFSGCKAWFEELRKKRVAELRQELEKSENSIGSLESKLESLKAEKENCCHSGNDTSKDGLSAGSFCQIQESVVEITTHPEVVETSNEQGVILQKRRGKRKRKDYCNRKRREWSENLSSTDVAELSNGEDNSTSEFDPMANSSCMNDYERGSCGVGNEDLVRIFNSIAENGNALVFRCRLDSQKRSRYKKTIRLHMDFDTIRMRIGSLSIASAKELFRDMLLVANNAVFFYAKRTREYKAALLLREIVTETYRQHEKDSSTTSAKIPKINAQLVPINRCLGRGNIRTSLTFDNNAQSDCTQTRTQNLKIAGFGTPRNTEKSQVCRKQTRSDSGPSAGSMIGRKT